MPSPIRLPAYLTSRSYADVVAVSQKILRMEEDITLDAGRLRFVDPFALTLLGSSFRQLRTRGLTVRVGGLNVDLQGYLSRMDLFNGVEIIGRVSGSNRRRDRADSLVELTHVETRSEVGPTSYRLACALVGSIPDVNPNEEPDEMTGFRTSERLERPIQYALNELLENALTHARGHGFRGTCVSVAGQYYPGRRMVQLAVSDNGCGFLSSLRGHPELHGETHQQAILLGLRPRVSCNRDLGILDDTANEGVGLTTAVRIAERAGGKAMVLSGNFMHDTVTSISGRLPGNTSWQGVAVVLEFRRDQLQNVSPGDLLPALDGGRPETLRFE